MIIITIIVSSQIFRGECKEHATNISNVDVEALRNLSSMFNSGKLKVSSLEVTDNIKGKTLDITDNIKGKTLDITYNGTIGPTMIGGLNNQVGLNNHACISHKKYGLKAANYALVQDIYGNTFINSAINKGVYVKGNLNAKGGLTVDGNLNVKGPTSTIGGNLDVKGTSLNVKGTFNHEGQAMYWFGRQVKAIGGSQVDDSNYWFYGVI